MLPEIESVIQSADISLHKTFEYTTQIKSWLAPVIDLHEFYVYPMNGITGCLDYYAGRERRGIFQDPGDYEWIMETGHDVKYMSYPSSIDGNVCDIPTDVAVVLDIAYVGTTEIRKIELPKNVEKVFYSLSKPFGMQNIRTGWYFTKRPDARLHKLTYDAHYYNYFAHQAAEAVIANFPIDYIYRKFKSSQSELCEHYNITPSDSIWLATSLAEEYVDFRRYGDVARLSLCGLMDY
jgi:hypothetical protein